MVALSEASPAPNVPEAMKEKAIAAAKTFCSGKDQLEILGRLKEICKQHLDIEVCKHVEAPEVTVEYVVKNFCEPMKEEMEEERCSYFESITGSNGCSGK